MDQAGLGGLELLFKSRPPENLTNAEEELLRMEIGKSRRGKRTSPQTTFCLIVKSLRRYRGVHIRASVDGVCFDLGERTEVFPGCFLIADYDKPLELGTVFLIEVEIWGSEGIISKMCSKMLNLEMTTKTLFPLEIVCEESREQIDVEVHCVKTNLAGEKICPSLKVIGHRGCGMNGLATTRLIENTVSSFLEAYKMGAGWIEMDIHLTRDEIPVVFHDFGIQVNETYVGINDLTLREFLELVGNSSEENDDLPCTLARILDKVDGDCGVNVEIKYPSPSEGRRYGLKNLISAEKVVEKITEEVQKNGRCKILFSSFHPHILLLLKSRFPNFNIYMLTEAQRHEDESPYTESLYGALQFCTKLGLDGVVLDWDCISSSPKVIIQVFRSFDLRTIVYGSEVNNRNAIDILNEAGVNGIILDDLELVSM